MAKVGVKINPTRHDEGFGALARGLDQSMNLVVYRFAINVQKHARINAPVDTGLMKSRIKARKIKLGVWHVEVGVHYGVYVEYGTRHMAAQPFFRPAFETARKNMRRDFGAVFKNNGRELRLR